MHLDMNGTTTAVTMSSKRPFGFLELMKQRQKRPCTAPAASAHATQIQESILRRAAYLHVVGSWDVGCSFEGVRHISQNLRGKEKVATVVAPPLQKLQETPYDLRHALPGQGPLTLREMLS